MTTSMTITEKILARHAGKESVSPGELIEVSIDLALANDVTAPLAFQVFDDLGKGEVFDPEKIALVADHFTPNKDIASAEQTKRIREFARFHKVKHYFDAGEVGIEHVILPEKGIVLPGDLVIGADSHTCTYGALGAFSTGMGSTDVGVSMATGKTWLKVPSAVKLVYEGILQPWVGGKDLILYTIGLLGVEGAVYMTLEFAGEVIRSLPMAQRLTMANMAVEAGAKNGIVEADDITRAYVAGKSHRQGIFLTSDPDAGYERVINIDVGQIAPQVALPHSPENVQPVSDIDHIRVDQVFIGSCTNGRIEDLREAVKVLEGHRVARDTRLIVIPGSPHVYRTAISEGLIQKMLEVGAVIGPPCCGPCLGGHMGILAEGEKAISTSNRNFIGRMGHINSEVYLSNPAVAAASAVLGRIGLPDEIN